MERSALPSLDDLRAFEATARRGTVRAAGDELALTHAAVSRRITRLAERVGVPLFERAGRGLRLTPAGEELHAACRRSFDDLSSTLAAIRAASSAEDGPILLSCERSVAMRWLVPRLSAFQDANPDVAVHLSVGGGALDSAAAPVTLALRRLDFELTQGWTVSPLFEETVGPVVSPALAGALANGDYLALGTRTRPDAWDRWLAAHPAAPRPKEVRLFDHHFLMVEAASSGLGVGLAPFVIAMDDLERGRLEAPFGFVADGSRYGLLLPAGRPLPEGARALFDWLVSTAAELHHPGTSAPSLPDTPSR